MEIREVCRVLFAAITLFFAALANGSELPYQLVLTNIKVVKLNCVPDQESGDNLSFPQSSIEYLETGKITTGRLNFDLCNEMITKNSEITSLYDVDGLRTIIGFGVKKGS